MKKIIIILFLIIGLFEVYKLNEWKKILYEQTKSGSSEQVDQLTELILENEKNWWNDGCTGTIGVYDVNLDHKVEWMVEYQGGSARNDGIMYYDISNQQCSFLCNFPIGNWELYQSNEKTCYFMKKIIPQTAGWTTTQYIERVVFNGMVQEEQILFQKDEISWRLEGYQPKLFEGRSKDSETLIIYKSGEQEISEEEMVLNINEYKTSMTNCTDKIKILYSNWNPGSSIEEKRAVIRDLLLDAYCMK